MWSGTKTPSSPSCSARVASDSASATVSCQMGSSTPYFMAAPPLESHHECVDDLVSLRRHLGPGGCRRGGLAAPARFLARPHRLLVLPEGDDEGLAALAVDEPVGRLETGVLSNAGLDVLTSALDPPLKLLGGSLPGTESGKHGATLRAPRLHVCPGGDNQPQGRQAQGGRQGAVTRAETGAPPQDGRPAMMRSAVARLVATGTLWTLHTRSSARMSGSCGWAKRGSTKKNTASISRMATPAAIWASPPSGPLRSSATSSPTLSRMSRAVWRVATSGNAARVSRVNVAHATRSTFL